MECEDGRGSERGGNGDQPGEYDSQQHDGGEMQCEIEGVPEGWILATQFIVEPEGGIQERSRVQGKTVHGEE